MKPDDISHPSQPDCVRLNGFRKSILIRMVEKLRNAPEPRRIEIEDMAKHLAQKEVDPRQRALLLIALHSGTRQRELLPLTREHFTSRWDTLTKRFKTPPDDEKA
jgi:integrase